MTVSVHQGGQEQTALKVCVYFSYPHRYTTRNSPTVMIIILITICIYTVGMISMQISMNVSWTSANISALTLWGHFSAPVLMELCWLMTSNPA